MLYKHEWAANTNEGENLIAKHSGFLTISTLHVSTKCCLGVPCLSAQNKLLTSATSFVLIRLSSGEPEDSEGPFKA